MPRRFRGNRHATARLGTLIATLRKRTRSTWSVHAANGGQHFRGLDAMAQDRHWPSSRRALRRARRAASIHAPRAGRDGGNLPLLRVSRCFNPRAPRGARPDSSAPPTASLCVSIHAPRAGRDACYFRSSAPEPCFNPRVLILAPGIFHAVSIHAPRAGRDRHLRIRSPHLLGFNPRAPRGARLPAIAIRIRHVRVSIHAPRAGRDDAVRRIAGSYNCFNPRAPRGARRA